jgi:hypothetical protein
MPTIFMGIPDAGSRVWWYPATVCETGDGVCRSIAERGDKMRFFKVKCQITIDKIAKIHIITIRQYIR